MNKDRWQGDTPEEPLRVLKADWLEEADQVRQLLAHLKRADTDWRKSIASLEDFCRQIQSRIVDVEGEVHRISVWISSLTESQDG